MTYFQRFGSSCPKAFIIVLFFFTPFFLFSNNASGQGVQYKWMNPLKDSVPVLEGQVLPKQDQNLYDRLPAAIKNNIDGNVWKESRQTAGMLIRFQTNADNIVVKYTVYNKSEATDLPETAISGIDLYAVDADGKFYWCNGIHHFGDTISYSFSNLKPNDHYHNNGREYRLYFPAFASVKSLEIGVPKKVDFTFLECRPDKPVVVYGGASVQGAAATRPGLSWTSILGRKLDLPLINLGFTSNNRLDKKIIGYLTGIDAQIYVLDCPAASGYSSAKEAKENFIQAVRQIKLQRRGTPILLEGYYDHGDDLLNIKHAEEDKFSNDVLQDAYDAIKEEGLDGVYLLESKEIKSNKNSLADSIDLNDIGMQQFARATEKITRKILHEPTCKASTTHPRTQKRDVNIYNWEIRHRYILRSVKLKQPKVIFIGNSITHYWGGLPHGPIESASDAKNPFFESLNAADLGYGWDRIENVLWRIYHGELDGYKATHAVLLIGTNNLDVNTNQQILEGLKFVINAIKVRQPGCRILMLGLTPRRGYEKRVAELNHGIARLAGIMNVNYADAGSLYLLPNGKIDESLFSDGLHPTAKGYRILENFLRPYLTEKNKDK